MSNRQTGVAHRIEIALVLGTPAGWAALVPALAASLSADDLARLALSALRAMPAEARRILLIAAEGAGCDAR